VQAGTSTSDAFARARGRLPLPLMIPASRPPGETGS
jgi:hypothetical protein